MAAASASASTPNLAANSHSEPADEDALHILSCMPEKVRLSLNTFLLAAPCERHSSPTRTKQQERRGTRLQGQEADRAEQT